MANKPVLLRVDKKTGEVKGVSTVARSYPDTLDVSERCFYLETDAGKKLAYAKLLAGGKTSVDKSDGAASAVKFDTLKPDEKDRPDIVSAASVSAGGTVGGIGGRR